MALLAATSWLAAMTAYANLRLLSMSPASGTGPDTYQYTHPTAKPTPRSKKRRGNSIMGAFTGIKAVISPRHEMTDEMTVPMMM